MLVGKVFTCSEIKEEIQLGLDMLVLLPRLFAIIILCKLMAPQCTFEDRQLTGKLTVNSGLPSFAFTSNLPAALSCSVVQGTPYSSAAQRILSSPC